MRILLLGRDGQVGWELARLLQPSAELSAPRRDELDLAQSDQLRAAIRDLRPEIVVNAAAYTAVDAAEKDEAMAAAINAHAPRVLAQEAARLGALLVHYSTDYVFDGSKGSPYHEDDPANPASAYGRTKLAGEQAIRAGGCRHLILRTSWIYAARGKNFVLTMLRLANERDELRVVADQVGSPTKARSLAEATVQMLNVIVPSPHAERGERVRVRGGGIYHITAANHTSWHAFAERIVERGAALGLCRKVPVRAITTAEYPTPAKRPAYSVLSNDRLAADFGIRLPAWQDALDDCLAEVPKRPSPYPSPR
jgi:dTDP-4-dehydrorhamnose reductase